MSSALYEEQRTSEATVAVWTVHIQFPAFEDLDEKNFYWATADGIELEDGNTYDRQLKEIPRGRHQTDRGNDYAEFTVSNPDNALYQEILPYENLIEKCKIVIRECFESETDFYTSEVRFYGFLKDFTLSDEDRAIQLTAVSDFSRTGFLVGNRILTRERCGTNFNINGLIAAALHICGWQTAQGGNPLFCTKKFGGVDGCEAHNNTDRFYAVPGLATATVEVIEGDPGGWGGGTGTCFSETTFVVMADWSLKPIHKVKATDRHLGFDLSNKDRLVKGEVLDTFKTLVDEIWNAEFEHASFEVRKDHLFYLGSRFFAPVAFLGDRPASGMDSEKKRGKSRLLSIERHIEQLFVYNLRTSTNNYIVTDKQARFFYMVHNRKPLYDPP